MSLRLSANQKSKINNPQSSIPPPLHRGPVSQPLKAISARATAPELALPDQPDITTRPKEFPCHPNDFSHSESNSVVADITQRHATNKYCSPKNLTTVTYYVQRRWGDSEDEPTEAKMRECLADLDTPDREHPDTWLEHESGWTLAVFESGLVVLENLEGDGEPRHMQEVSRAEALRMWLLLSRGALDEIESLPWKDGYGPPMPDEERQKLQQEAAEVTLKMQRDFYDTLGPEDSERSCRKEGCARGTVKFSAFCRPHHFENLYKKPCPFDH